MGPNDRAWEEVIEELDIDLSKDISEEIRSSQVKEISGREPRLAAKLDSREDTPRILKDNGLFILPVKNGVYRLVRADGFHDLEPIEDEPMTFVSQVDFEITTGGSTGESNFIQYAENSGLLAEVTGMNDLILTETSRYRACGFDFYLDDVGPIHQEGTQVQTDGLYENNDSVVILEAKTRNVSSFNIRQLYYPYRDSYERTDKEIIALFLVVGTRDEVYKFWEYTFEDPMDYGSIELISKGSYKVVEEPLDEGRLQVEKDSSKGWYIPQADSVEKIQEYPLLVERGYDTSRKIADFYGFHPRQSNYYREPVEMLDLIEVQREGRRNIYRLTDKGQEYVDKRTDKRNEMLAKQMMKLPVMNEVFDMMLKRTKESLGEEAKVTKDDMIEIIEQNTDYSHTTARRRSNSILSWFGWISKNIGIVTRVGDEIHLAVNRQGKLF